MQNEIKSIREKLGLTQEDFAHKLGVTTRTISRWETGKSRPSRMARQLIKLMLKKIEAKTNL